MKLLLILAGLPSLWNMIFMIVAKYDIYESPEIFFANVLLLSYFR